MIHWYARSNAINLITDLHNHNLCNHPNCDICGSNFENASNYNFNCQRKNIFKSLNFLQSSIPISLDLLCGDSNSSFGKIKHCCI